MGYPTVYPTGVTVFKKDKAYGGYTILPTVKGARRQGRSHREAVVRAAGIYRSGSSRVNRFAEYKGHKGEAAGRQGIERPFAGLSGRVRALAALFLLAGALVLSGCAGGAPATGSSAAAGSTADSAAPAGTASESGKITFTDDLGNEVTVDDPRRVVAGMGSLADAWIHAGGEDTLVATTDDAFENYGVDDDKVASVGRSTSLNLEKIIAQKPDFVIMTGIADGKHDTGVSQADLKAALDKSGIPVAFFKVSTFDDYLRMLKTLTSITGRQDLYKKNGTDVRARIEKDIDRYSVADREGGTPTALVVSAYSKGVKAQDSTGMAGAMLKQLGAVNNADEIPSLLTDLSQEAVVEADPDYVFVLAVGRGDAAAQKNVKKSFEDDPAWQSLAAVKEGRLTVLDAAHFLYKPNARWDESYEILGKALQGK